MPSVQSAFTPATNRLALVLVLALLHSHGLGEPPNSESSNAPQITATFSIVAADPESGVCGAAVASKYPAVGEVVPFVRGGVGAFCTQHWHNPDWGQRALDLLEKGKSPEQVFATLLDGDPNREKRQLAIIDMQGRALNRNPTKADPSGIYWAGMTGRYYACQGNTLVGRKVIVAMARAYEDTKGSLADRLMASLVAGDRAGGDHRGRLAAGIRVAKKDVEGCWLELQVDDSDDAVAELAKKYGALKHPAKKHWPSPASADSGRAARLSSHPGARPDFGAPVSAVGQRSDPGGREGRPGEATGRPVVVGGSEGLPFGESRQTP